jgi:hypothetical protein
MSRSAFLPDPNQLRGLLRGLHAKPGSPASAVRVAAPPGHYRSLDTDPPTLPLRGAALDVQPFQPSIPPRRPLGITQPPEAPIRQALAVAGDSLDERFAAFAAWAKDATGAATVFVTDREGLSMVPSTATEDYLAVAAEISAAQRKLSHLLPTVEGGSTQLELQPSPLMGVRWVELISCTTHFGDFTIGLLLSEQLGAGLTTRLRTALRSYLTVDADKAR